MRITVQTTQVRDLLSSKGHASNIEIYRELPLNETSQTTVHRITKRLYEHGEIALAPRGVDGEVRYDSNVNPHHHFMCSKCSRLCDIPLSPQIDGALAILKSLATECAYGDSVTLMGICRRCAQAPIRVLANERIL